MFDRSACLDLTPKAYCSWHVQSGGGWQEGLVGSEGLGMGAVGSLDLVW